MADTVQVGDLTVNRLGLGTNRITDTPEARALLNRAVELGINFVDTAYAYTNGASETTIGKTLAPYTDGLVVATKGGWDNTRPEELRGLLEESLRRLKTDCIDLYQLHRVNPDVPIEDSVGMFKRFQDEGKIRYIGLSEVSVDQLKRAQAVTPIASVQNEYNVAVRKHEALVDYCTEQGIAFIPWFPLGGLRGDTAKVERLVGEVAEKYQATSQQIALAWLLKRSPIILPIPGTLSIDHLEDNLKAAAIKLSDQDYQQLDKLLA
jgi:pyridoxine 4-dehydrogenase